MPLERRKLIDTRKNPFYRHAERELFLAERDGRVVGRIGAIVNHNHNRHHNDRVGFFGFFGFFESIDDQTVAAVLFEAAKGYLRGRGMDAMRGPANPHDDLRRRGDAEPQGQDLPDLPDGDLSRAAAGC